jgi:hypothetical protein
MHIFLDLDNTLIHAIEPQQVSYLPQTFQKQFRFVDMKPYYRVYERPHLQMFLDFLFQHFNVSVWTAAESDYAIFIIKHFILVKPERKLKNIFYRYHVSLAQQQYGDTNIKDLRLMWELFKVPGVFPCNTFIVDDLEDVKETNTSNCLPIKAFEVINGKKPNTDAIYDDSLLKTKLELEKLLYQYDTVLKPNIVDNLISRFNQPALITEQVL